MALAARLPSVDLFLSAAGEEVLEIYKLPIEELKSRFRVFRDKTASGVPVGTPACSFVRYFMAGQ